MLVNSNGIFCTLMHNLFAISDCKGITFCTPTNKSVQKNCIFNAKYFRFLHKTLIVCKFLLTKSSPFPHQLPLHIIVYIIQPLNFRCPKTQLLSSCSVRRPIGFRPPPDRIPFAARSDSVRRPTPSRILSSPTHNTFTITSKPSQNTSFPSIPTFLAFNPLKPPILVDLSQIEPKNATFLKLFLQNTCMVMIFVIPLHPLSRTN